MSARGWSLHSGSQAMRLSIARLSAWRATIRNWQLQWYKLRMTIVSIAGLPTGQHPCVVWPWLQSLSISCGRGMGGAGCSRTTPRLHKEGGVDKCPITTPLFDTKPYPTAPIGASTSATYVCVCVWTVHASFDTYVALQIRLAPHVANLPEVLLPLINHPIFHLQSSFKKSSRVERFFQPAWYKKWPFLHYDKANDLAYSHMCVSDFK